MKKRPAVALLIETSNAYARGLLAGIVRYARELHPGGVLLFNGDTLRCDPVLIPEGVRVLPLPFKALTQEMGSCCR